jgi:hypothetical protein
VKDPITDNTTNITTITTHTNITITTRTNTSFKITGNLRPVLQLIAP